MKITLPGLDDGAIASSEDGKQYRVKNHVAHIRPEDYEGLGLNEYKFTRFDAHPYDPNQKIRRDFEPVILMQESDPVYTDDSEKAGDFSHPDDAISQSELHRKVMEFERRPQYAAPSLTADDIINAVAQMSPAERKDLAKAIGADSGEERDSGGEAPGETPLDAQGGHVDKEPDEKPAPAKRRR